MIEDRPTHRERSKFELTFDQTVSVTEHFYPEFSLSTFLSSLGGVVGLRLGISVVQIGALAMELVLKIKLSFCSNK